MKKHNNQKGYALVLVLIMITIFSLLFIMLAGNALTSYRQINMSEDNVQATTLAEMGVVHYHTLILDAIESVLEDPFTADLIQKEIDKVDDFDTLTDEEKISTLRGIIADVWKVTVDIPTLTTRPMHVNEQLQHYFDIESDNVTVTKDQNGLKFNFVSKGSNNIKIVGLETTINIPIDAFININIGDEDGSNGGGNGTTPGDGTFDGSLISKPTGLPTCTDEDDTNCSYNGTIEIPRGNYTLNGSTLHVTESFLLESNTNRFTNSLIYVEGEFTTKNMNRTTNLQLHVEEDATIDSNMNSLFNSIIEILGSATFSGNIQNASNSIIYVGQNADFEGNNISFNNNSTVYTGGDATMNNVTVDNSSRICVEGHLEINGNNVSGANIFANTTNRPNLVNTSSEDFEANCSGVSIGDRDMITLYPEWDWELLTPETNYNYSY
ncbi:hypothetical protein BKP35_14390 [Anaerobacillus arseniciselenatis]|uniref:Uncharacterized protein n=1 Tax=Anaerobacillus arseniciselenatis TaxID=85682 RepID=A0A1S2LDY1_9BACI|nr:hypothetical protein [Anaerobacillus arseniciselenatis]OIJ10283.1 hypothetical protein BKP35_14390 [Anaerobacillus arseniciselenatis]